MEKTVFSMFSAILVMSMLNLAFNIQLVKALETVYIRGDGLVDPSTEPIQRDGNIYTLNGTIYDSIVVERDNIMVDGAGYTLKGTGGGNGIDLTGRSNVTIKNMTIKEFYHGVFLNDSSYNTIVENSITNNDFGVFLNNSSYNNITRNSITNNKIHDGVRLDNSSYNSIDGNSITNNSNGDGIFLNDFCLNNGIVGNKIEDNNIGILPDNSSNNSIIGNVIRENTKWGISFSGSSSDNVIYHNDFVDNGLQVNFETPDYANRWDNGSGGNYWSDYPCQDSDGDGIGDRPYDINKNNQDNYPLMNPWNPTTQNSALPLFWIIIAIVTIIIVSVAILVVRKLRRKDEEGGEEFIVEPFEEQ